MAWAAAWPLTAVCVPPPLTHRRDNLHIRAPHLGQLRGKFLLSLQVGTLAPHLTTELDELAMASAQCKVVL